MNISIYTNFNISYSPVCNSAIEQLFLSKYALFSLSGLQPLIDRHKIAKTALHNFPGNMPI